MVLILESAGSPECPLSYEVHTYVIQMNPAQSKTTTTTLCYSPLLIFDLILHAPPLQRQSPLQNCLPLLKPLLSHGHLEHVFALWRPQRTLPLLKMTPAQSGARVEKYYNRTSLLITENNMHTYLLEILPFRFLFEHGMHLCSNDNRDCNISFPCRSLVYHMDIGSMSRLCGDRNAHHLC